MEASKRFAMRHNVTFRVLDKSGYMVSEHKGHNSATNTLIEGIGHYLAGEGVLRQGYSMLSRFIPKYISLGTMGLYNQDEDSEGLPTGISGKDHTGNPEKDFASYMKECPGYGTDGYSYSYNNSRPYYGLGPAFTSFSTDKSYYKGDATYYKGKKYIAQADMVINPENGTYNYWTSENWKLAPTAQQPICWELISPTFPRQEISFRDVVPEYESENPKTIDVIFSAMISAGALDQFRASNKDYIFITEAGLWSDSEYQEDGVGVNNLVAGYRIVPPNYGNWYMSSEEVPDVFAIAYLAEHGIVNPTDAQIAQAKITLAAENRKVLQEQILRVERDQVVQVIWKIEIGNLEDERNVTVSYITGDIEQKIKELETLIGNKVLYAENISIPASRWVSASGGYAASISMDGVDATYFPMVEFTDADTIAFDLKDESKTSQNTVTVYCTKKPNRTIVVPIIICSKGSAVTAS